MKYKALALVLALASTTSPSAAGDGGYAPGSWSGIYIGAAVGYGISDTEFTHDLTVAVPAYSASLTNDNSLDGITGTVSIGFDRQVGSHWLAGAFVDYTFGELEGDGTKYYPTPPGADRYSLKLDNVWAFGGRIGYAFDASTMSYVSGGYTIADMDFKDSFGPLSEDLEGWFIGVGVEHKLRPNVGVTFSYRFSDFGSDTLYQSATPPCCSERFETDVQVHAIQIGLTYRFGDSHEARAVPLK